MRPGEWQIFDENGDRKYVDLAEFRRFIDATRILHPRIRAFCQLLAYTGCRISEGLGLRGTQVGDNEVVLRTLKRRRPVYRLVQIPTWLGSQLTLLVAELADPAERIFPESRSTAYRNIKFAMQLAYIEIAAVQACPKGLRHGFGVRSAMCGVPGSLIQTSMGHARFSTTLAYMDIVGGDARIMLSRTWY